MLVGRVRNLAGYGLVQRSLLGFVGERRSPARDGHGVDQLDFVGCGGLEVGDICGLKGLEGGGRIVVQGWVGGGKAVAEIVAGGVSFTLGSDGSSERAPLAREAWICFLDLIGRTSPRYDCRTVGCRGRGFL